MLQENCGYSQETDNEAKNLFVWIQKWAVWLSGVRECFANFWKSNNFLTKWGKFSFHIYWGKAKKYWKKIFFGKFIFQMNTPVALILISVPDILTKHRPRLCYTTSIQLLEINLWYGSNNQRSFYFEII